jgi:hypothetical protein
MNRGYLALAAGLVIAAGLALYILSRPAADPSASGSTASREATGARIKEADRGNPNRAPRIAPIGPDDTPAQATPGTGSAVREYVVGGIRVRDHRVGDHPQVEIPPAIHPPHGRRIPSRLTYDVTQKVRGVVNECAASVQAASRGPKAGLDGQVMIAIKDHQATVTRATFVLRDVASPDPAVKQCLEQKAIGLATPSGDEADVENYAITLSLRLP